MVNTEKKLPFWWMAAIEIVLFAVIVYSLYDEKYVEALLTALLIEVRQISWQMKSAD